VDILNAIKSLKLPTSVNTWWHSQLYYKSFLSNLAPVPKQINFGLSLQHFPTPRKQAATVPVLKKGSSALVIVIIDLHLPLKNFSKVFEFVVNEHSMHYCKLKLNTCQHGLLKSKSTATNLVTYLGYISAFNNYQNRVHAFHFYLSSAIDLVLLEKT
jgi:hypothetical protein